VHDAEGRAITRRIICNKVTDAGQRKHQEPCLATSAVTRSTKASL
jgi:hypothetical protein